MEDIFNRGLKFFILPNKLDITKVNVDFTYFSRTMIWKEFWFGKEQEEKICQEIFKRRKRHLDRFVRNRFIISYYAIHMAISRSNVGNKGNKCIPRGAQTHMMTHSKNNFKTYRKLLNI